MACVFDKLLRSNFRCGRCGRMQKTRTGNLAGDIVMLDSRSA